VAGQNKYIDVIDETGDAIFRTYLVPIEYTSSTQPKVEALFDVNKNIISRMNLPIEYHESVEMRRFYLSDLRTMANGTADGATGKCKTVDGIDCSIRSRTVKILKSLQGDEEASLKTPVKASLDILSNPYLISNGLNQITIG